MFKRNELLAHEMTAWRSTTSKLTGASGSAFVMFEKSLQGTTASPGSSTRAVIRCLMEISVFVVWSSKTPS